MRKILLIFAAVIVLAGCSAKAEPAAGKSAGETVQAVLGDRLLDFSESSGNVSVQLKARDAGSAALIKKGILEDARYLVQSLSSNPNYARPGKVSVSAVFSVKSETGQLRDAEVGHLVFDRSDPVAWENLPRLADFEQLLSVADFPYN